MTAEERARAVLSRTSAVGRAGFDGLVSLIAAAIRDAEREAAERMRAECRYAMCQWCRLVLDYRDGEHHLGSKTFPCRAMPIREMEVTP